MRAQAHYQCNTIDASLRLLCDKSYNRELQYSNRKETKTSGTRRYCERFYQTVNIIKIIVEGLGNNNNNV